MGAHIPTDSDGRGVWSEPVYNTAPVAICSLLTWLLLEGSWLVSQVALMGSDGQPFLYRTSRDSEPLLPLHLVCQQRSEKNSYVPLTKRDVVFFGHAHFISVPFPSTLTCIENQEGIQAGLLTSACHATFSGWIQFADRAF